MTLYDSVVDATHDSNSTSWYATPQGAVRKHFMAILKEELQRILKKSWNSERPLIFDHVILTKMLDIFQAREVRARISR